MKITVAGIPGEAYLDTGAVTSVASSSLHAALQKRGIPSRKQNIETTLADGRKVISTLDTYTLPVKLEGRELHTEFIVLPASENKRTLLGFDVIEDVGAAIITPFQHWYFVDEPEHRFPYFKPKDARPPKQVSAVQGKAPKPTSCERLPKHSLPNPTGPFFTDYRQCEQAISSEFEKQYNLDYMRDSLHIGSLDARLRQRDGTPLAEKR